MHPGEPIGDLDDLVIIRLVMIFDVVLGELLDPLRDFAVELVLVWFRGADDGLSVLS